MTSRCPADRSCSSCPYEPMCGGCLEDGCVHVREKKSSVDHSKAKCSFCEMKRIDNSCPTTNPPPPKELTLMGPWVLEQTIGEWKINLDEVTTQPEEPEWPLLIPEVSDITETTSRLGVWRDEGDWKFRKWDPIAWDMTGYLFDNIQGAPWVRDPEILQEEDWRSILGPEENWISNILMVDRLPDRLAMQTPPTAIMIAYLNRIWAYHWKMLTKDSPKLWMLTHGYPSYIDWPPAWHWNLGMRMLSSLAAYIGSQGHEMMGHPEGIWYPDLSKKTDQYMRLPHAIAKGGERLLWDPDVNYDGAREVDWTRFPGIIPFVPGADTNQLAWFTKMIVKMGYTTVAIDAVNSIAHENFKGLPEAVTAVRSAGAKHVIVYGPWPLHPPSRDIPIHSVSYIPTSLHMDMTNTPARFWRKKKETKPGEKRQWRKLPNYRRVNLGEVVYNEDAEICTCPACQAACIKEFDPRSIWRWGHMLNAGDEWEQRMKKRRGRKSEPETQEMNTRLWYQGPSYTVFRKCLHFHPGIQWKGIEDMIESIIFSDTKMEFTFPDGERMGVNKIRWTWFPEGHTWEWEFPFLS